MPIKTITAPTVEPITLAEAKLHLRVDGTDEDTLIGAYITAARELAESMADRAYAEGTYELTADAFPAEALHIGKPPLISIVSVKYLDTDGAEQTLAPTDYILDADDVPGNIYPAPGKTWPATQAVTNAVRVRFTAGAAPADVSQRVKLYMLLHIAYWYEQRSSVNVGNIVNEMPGVRQLIAFERWSWF